MSSAVHQIEIPATAEDNFIHASFTLSQCDYIKDAKLILVLLTGFNGDSSPLAQDPLWLATAHKHHVPVLTCTFKSTPGEPNPQQHYAAAQHGSGSALEKALAEFAQQLNAAQLKSLPLFIHGFSAGGQFAYGFSCYRPERLLGFSSAKGGYYFPQPKALSYCVPGLLNSGFTDLQRRRDGIRHLFESHRKHGAPWIWLEDETAHVPGNCRPVSIAFFEALIACRLQDGRLIDLDVNTALFVELQTQRLIEGKEKTKIPHASNPKLGYIPSRAFYEIWRGVDNAADKYRAAE